MNQKIAEFLKAFLYERSKLGIFGGWKLISYRGDCEDFALTILYMIEGSWAKVIWSIITFKAVFWLTHSPSNKFWPRHTVLWYRGYGWIDSSNREWRAAPTPHKLRLPWLFPLVFVMMIWGLVEKKIF